MIKGIKELADTGDVRRLKYIFVDALDVDPTFVRYEESFNYIKSVSGVLEPHVELTPFKTNKNDWNEEYWNKLKRDLMENFSEVRMAHIREVAQVFYAEKVQRILAERASNDRNVDNDSTNDVIASSTVINNVTVHDQGVTMLTRAEQELMLQQKRLKYAEEKRLREQEERIENEQREVNQESSGLSKKVIGVAIAAVVGIAILYQILN